METDIDFAGNVVHVVSDLVVPGEWKEKWAEKKKEKGYKDEEDDDDDDDDDEEEEEKEEEEEEEEEHKQGKGRGECTSMLTLEE